MICNQPPPDIRLNPRPFIVVAVLVAMFIFPGPLWRSTLASELRCPDQTHPVNSTSPSTYDNVTIQSGCTLSADAALAVTGNMTVESGGIVSHSARLLTGLVLNVTG